MRNLLLFMEPLCPVTVRVLDHSYMRMERPIPLFPNELFQKLMTIFGPVMLGAGVLRMVYSQICIFVYRRRLEVSDPFY
jgi:hypothetical protein